MFFWILGVLIILAISIAVIGHLLSAPGYTGPKTDHFNGTSFTNLNGAKSKGFGDVFKWILRRDQGPWSQNYETTVGPKPTSSSEQLKITFVNHSTFLIQWNDINILTDPIWSERCSPVSFAGPARMRTPGIRYEDLPTIDMVLLSHNHYDHLDLPTVKKLESDFSPLFITPLGVSRFLAKKGIKNTLELDWWDETTNRLKITAVPAQHFSSRGMFDRDKTLWAGYVLEYEDKKVYFAGDSGYGPFFKKIGKKFGPIDVSLIPIGAYLPRWFMSPIHVSPDEAVRIHQDVKSRHSIAMHFGTFPLADEGQGKAEEDLILALEAGKVEQKAFVIPQEGEAITFPMD